MSECIPTSNPTDQFGYGRVWFESTRTRAHRKAYCIAQGVSLSSIKGMIVRHKCDNPSCVNPAHLIIGTHQDNMTDKVQRNRQWKPTGTQHHLVKLTEDDVRYIHSNTIKGSRDKGTRAMGRRFHVDNTTICLILKGKNWSTLT